MRLEYLIVSLVIMLVVLVIVLEMLGPAVPKVSDTMENILKWLGLRN